MRIFTTIILCFVWLSSFSQEKTIVVKKENPELTIAGVIKNGGALKRNLLDNNLKLKVKNCDCHVVSYSVLIPLSNGAVEYRNYIDERLSEEVRTAYRFVPSGGVLTISSITILIEGKEVPYHMFSVRIID